MDKLSTFDKEKESLNNFKSENLSKLNKSELKEKLRTIQETYIQVRKRIHELVGAIIECNEMQNYLRTKKQKIIEELDRRRKNGKI